MPWQHTPYLNNGGGRGCDSVAEGMTQTEVAERVGLTRARVQQIEHHGIRAIWRMQVSERFRRQREGQMR